MGAALFYASLAMIFLRRLLPWWQTAIPGGLEDTRLFLWNAWWFHRACESLHTNPFRTSYLFHPFGVSLLSHDYPLWTNAVTWVSQRAGVSLIGSSNIWFWITWFLTGFCTYLLAREVTNRQGPALVAGVFVMTHSYTLARAMQNWGQFNVYGLSLFLWALVCARRSKKTWVFALAGVALAWTAACHFYFLLYSVAIWLAVAAVDLSPVGFRLEKDPLYCSWRPVALGMVGLSAVLAGWIILFRPNQLLMGSLVIGLESPANALLVMWIFFGVFSASFVRVVWMDRFLEPTEQRRRLTGHLILLGVSAICLSPLLVGTIQLIGQGGYPKQSILWKTHPLGANLFSLFMPNPLHAVWGSAVSGWYEVRGMNPQEQAASLGWIVIGVILWTRLWRSGQRERRWLALATGATLLSMGVYLHLAQRNTWLPLPFYFWRLIPVLGNVRIPERWMAVGAVAWSVVLALGILRLSERRKWNLNIVCATALLLVLGENWPGLPVYRFPPPLPVYQILRQQPPGGVLALPLYIGDSSIGTGDAMPSPWVFPWDHLWAQTIYEKPLVGGYIGRLPRKLIRSYQADSFINRLLALEEGQSVSATPDREAARKAAEGINMNYVLIYRPAIRPEALQFVMNSLALQPIETGSPVELYTIVR
ncbi:MAG: hypothetical protein WC859_07590 [Elusimicrobiota bacterium]